MIKTKSIFQPESLSDGIRILITHSVSNKLRQFHFDKHISKLAPSKSLLNNWLAKRISWAEYTKCFLEEMNSKQSKNIIIKLAMLSMKGETITLLCYEKEENPHCHRHIVKKLISEIELN